MLLQRHKHYMCSNIRLLVCSGEVWGLDVDAAEQRLATGSADADLRLYSIHAPDSSGMLDTAPVLLRCFACAMCRHNISRLSPNAGKASGCSWQACNISWRPVMHA